MNLAGKTLSGAHRALVFLLLSLSCLGVRGETNAPSMTLALLPQGAVRMEILEGLPDQLSWSFTNPPVSETYSEPAFGFVVLPTKYSPKGIKLDRQAPFLLRASGRVILPPGDQQVLLRVRTGARLFLDGRLLLATQFASLNSDGHEEVPEVPMALAPNVRFLQAGQSEAIATVTGDGAEHVLVVEAIIGLKERRPEVGELTVSLGAKEAEMFHLLAPLGGPTVALTDQAWQVYDEARRADHAQADAVRRRALARSEEAYWTMRHRRARDLAASQPVISVPATTDGASVLNDIDRFINAKLASVGAKPAPLLGDYAFLRRVAFDTVGRAPSLEELNQFLADPVPDRRARAITRYLEQPGWADHWVSYWQDVLAENPGILKPMLNNTGPFRWYLHEAFRDNKLMDRFVTELILMEGSANYGGPAGFGIATENDVPMAQKAQIIAQAFLGMQLQCARCHDAPYTDFLQRDLFGLAAMLKRGTQVVPLSSSIPTNANIIVGRRVKVTLPPGSRVDPVWTLTNAMPDHLPDGILRDAKDSRERLAALVTDPRNERFARVLVNRLWQRYFGKGIVEPVDDWETPVPSHPALLDWLARELVTHDYDLKHVAGLILGSHTYQREARSESGDTPEKRLFAGPARRRLSAEQIVDSLFTAVGKRFESEEMNMDVDGRRPVKEFKNLGKPYHAWEFASLSNERDRPALAMPRAQQIADTLSTFGWRESRQGPQALRDDAPNVLQPATIANGLLANGRITRLSDDHALTALAVQSELTLHQLTLETFLRLLSRPPSVDEEKLFAGFLQPGFESRLDVDPIRPPKIHRSQRPVSWSNHLNPEATQLKLDAERAARAGDPPSDRILPAWRERMEDAVWALINSPEFVFVP